MTNPTEFNLSEKRKELSNYGLKDRESFGGAAKFYREDDVKEFIRLLKESYFPCDVCSVVVTVDTIDKLAGENLK